MAGLSQPNQLLVKINTIPAEARTLPFQVVFTPLTAFPLSKKIMKY